MTRHGFPLVTVIAIILISLMLHPFGPIALPSVPRVLAVSPTIFLRGFAIGGWNNTIPGPALTVAQGDTVTMMLQSGDNMLHRFFVDVDRAGPIPNCQIDKCSPSFGACTGYGCPSITYTFTVDFAPGTYTYYCSFHPTIMFGELVVKTSPDFSLKPDPSSLIIPVGSSGRSTVNVTATSGFTGTVNLSAAALPVGPIASLEPTSLMLSATIKSATSALTVSVPPATPAGSYTVTVTGENGTESRSTKVLVTVPPPDFSISANPSSLTIRIGSSNASMLTLTSLKGFTGTTGLSATVSILGPTVSFSNAMISGSGTSLISIMVPHGTHKGIFTVTVVATSGALSHSLTVTVAAVHHT